MTILLVGANLADARYPATDSDNQKPEPKSEFRERKAKGGLPHSHSIVPGGLLVTS
jgi:hypothetical protein